MSPGGRDLVVLAVLIITLFAARERHYRVSRTNPSPRMPISNKPSPNTAIWRTRRRLNVERKQVAWVLGHASPDQIARYERGEVEPSLDNAIRLSIIYGCDLEGLFPHKYESFRRELASKALSMKTLETSSDYDLFARVNVCSYEDALGDPDRAALYFSHVRDHVTRLAKRLAGL